MFKIILIATLIAHVAASGSSADDVHAEVKQLKSHVDEHGFQFVLDTSNSIHEDSAGDEQGNIHGSYEFVSPEGEHVKVTYTADKDGFHPDSALLPTPPPIPDAILKSIEYNKAHPEKEEVKGHK
ncbi:larval cuticle protein 4-like [Haematobia irritans]|uniref:larval cuticle protein 4-like n=1 Tax=Haematobia irritans TaxID=7368 RepID=UPI003F4FCA7C